MSRRIAYTTRAVHAPFYLADEQLEYFAEVYLAMPEALRESCGFEQFLAATPAVRDSRPLLPAQRAVRERLLSTRDRMMLREALAVALSTIGNGRHIEKLRHHRHPRSRRAWPAQEG